MFDGRILLLFLRRGAKDVFAFRVLSEWGTFFSFFLLAYFGSIQCGSRRALGSNSSARNKLVSLLHAAESGSPERIEAYAWCLIGADVDDGELQAVRDLLSEQEADATLSAGKAKAIELKEAIMARAEHLLPKPRDPQRGTFIYPTGERYFGQIRAGRPHGHGILASPSGERFYGEFQDGKANGHGVLFDQSGRVLFSGLWRNDKALAADGMPLPVLGKRP